MTGAEPTVSLSLRTLVPAAIAVWVATFWFVHGPWVFAYLLMHLVTTGVFLAAICLSDRSRQAPRVAPSYLRVVAERSREHASAMAERTVAS
jgi:hypothetical protein